MFIPDGTPGSRASFLYKCQELLRQEHNTKIIGNVFRSKRTLLNDRAPELADKRIVWIRKFWGRIDIANKEQAMPYMEEAYRQYELYGAYYRNDYGPRIREVHKELLKALSECEQDDFSTHPTLEDPTTENAFAGVISKTFLLTENEGTNIARVKRFLATHQHLPEDDKYKKAAYAALTTVKQQCHEGTFHNPDISKIKAGIPLPELPDPLENYTTYTEVDPATYFDVTANQITITNLPRNVDAYVYKDAGVNKYSGDFEFLVDTKHTAGTGISVVCSLSNTINDLKDALTDADGIIYVAFNGINLALGAYIGSLQSDLFAYTNDTWYYLVWARDEGANTLTCKIYSDVDRTTLVDTLTVTPPSNRDYRYVYAAQSYNDGVATTVSAINANLDLQGAPIGFPFFFDGAHT